MYSFKSESPPPQGSPDPDHDRQALETVPAFRQTKAKNGALLAAGLVNVQGVQDAASLAKRAQGAAGLDQARSSAGHLTSNGGGGNNCVDKGHGDVWKELTQELLLRPRAEMTDSATGVWKR